MRSAFLRRATPGMSENAGGESLYVRQGTWPRLALLFINLCEHLVLMEKTPASLAKVVPSTTSQKVEQTDSIKKKLNTRLEFSCFNDKGTGDIWCKPPVLHIAQAHNKCQLLWSVKLFCFFCNLWTIHRLHQKKALHPEEKNIYLCMYTSSQNNSELTLSFGWRRLLINLKHNFFYKEKNKTHPPVTNIQPVTSETSHPSI